MLTSVSSSWSLPSSGRAVSLDGTVHASPPAQRRASAPAHPDRSVQPVSIVATGTPIPRARLSSLYSVLPERQAAMKSGHVTLVATASAPAGTPISPHEFKIPTRVTLEIQRVRDAIAESGGGLRAMQHFVRELAKDQSPRISRTV